MKKILSIVLVFAFMFLLTACGSKELDVSKTKQDKFNQLNYEVPEAFKKQSVDRSDVGESVLVFSDYQYTFEKVASNGKFDDMCSLSFFYDTDFLDYTLEKYAAIYNEKSGTRKTINGVEWIVVKDELTDKMVDYNYYAKYNNTWYEVSYSDWGSGSLCGDAQDVIINSLKFGN